MYASVHTHNTKTRAYTAALKGWANVRWKIISFGPNLLARETRRIIIIIRPFGARAGFLFPVNVVWTGSTSSATGFSRIPPGHRAATYPDAPQHPPPSVV